MDGDKLPKEFEVVLEAGTEIGGIVTDEQGEPIEGVKVEIKDATVRSPIDPKFFPLKDDKEKLRPRPSRATWLTEKETAPRTDSEGRWTAKTVPKDSDLVLTGPFIRGSYPNSEVHSPSDPPLRLRYSHPDYKTFNGFEHANRKQNPSLKILRSKTAAVALKRGADKESEISNAPVWPTDPLLPADDADKRE